MEQREGRVLGAWSVMSAENRDGNFMLSFLFFSLFTQFNCQTVRDW